MFSLLFFGRGALKKHQNMSYQLETKCVKNVFGKVTFSLAQIGISLFFV